jgi:flagellar basal body-associated protein FliL
MIWIIIAAFVVGFFVGAFAMSLLFMAGETSRQERRRNMWPGE